MTSLWRRQLRPGSFRGVEFQCDKHDFESGRRIVDHVFPYRDETWTEDLGLKQRVYKLNMYVIGSDYFKARNNLIEALEKGSPAILVHPYLGSKTVEASDFSLSETNDQGGMALFTVTFRETARVANPIGIKDALGDIKDKANSLQTALIRATEFFKTPSSASFLLESATSLVRDVSDTLSSVSAALPNNSQGISELGYSIRNLKANARYLAARPSQLGQAIVDAVRSVTSILNINGLLPEDENGRVILPNGPQSADGKAKRNVFEPCLTLPLKLPPTLETTPSRRQEKKNQEILSRLVVGSAIAELSVVSVSTDYESFTDAVNQRDLILFYINQMLASNDIDDDSFNALQALSTSVVNSLPDVRLSYPRLSKLKLIDLTPSLVVAYNLYGDVSREYDIIARNHVSHPAFISPLKPLEVVANE